MRADVSGAESDGFSAVVERQAAHLHDYCRALLTGREDAVDAARATLVLAYWLLDRLEDGGRVRAWLLALARRECRSANPVRSRLLARLPGAPAGELDGEDQHRGTGTGLTAAAALRTLPAAEREVLDLVYRHYLSTADVAAVLGESADRAAALLASAVTGFRSASEHDGDGPRQVVQPPDASGRLVTGVRAISAIPLVALPPSILADVLSIVADPEFATCRESLASAVGDLGPDGFPLPRRQVDTDPERQRRGRQRSFRHDALAHYAALRRAVRPTTVLETAGRVPRRRLAVLGAALVALVAAVATMASSSSGVPIAISRTIGQALGQDPVGPPRVGTRRLPGPVPITALLPRKRDKGIILPMLPAGNGAPGTSSPRPRPASSPPMTTAPVTPSSSPTPSSPSPTPTSPSPTPTSPPPTPSSPPPTPTASP